MKQKGVFLRNLPTTKGTTRKARKAQRNSAVLKVIYQSSNTLATKIEKLMKEREKGQDVRIPKNTRMQRKYGYERILSST